MIPVGPARVDQFPGLLHVAIQQHQVFGFARLRLRTFVAEQEDVARHERRDFVGRNFLADRRHAQERAHRAGDRYRATLAAPALDAGRRRGVARGRGRCRNSVLRASA